MTQNNAYCQCFIYLYRVVIQDLGTCTGSFVFWGVFCFLLELHHSDEAGVFWQAAKTEQTQLQGKQI